MSIFWSEMTRGIAINILGIDVCTMLDKCLDYTQVASQTCNVKRCSKIVGSCIDLGFELHQYLNQWSVSFTGRQMQRRESIGVGAVDNLKQLVSLIELLLGVAQDLEYFILIPWIHLCPVVHFNFLNIFLSLPLLWRFLRNRRSHILLLLTLHLLLRWGCMFGGIFTLLVSIASTVSSELISLLVIVI